jgi:DNA-binding NtrC family response regulator
VVTQTLSTQIVEGPNARLVLDQAELKVVAGPDRGSQITLGADSVIIGSSPQCELVLHDSTVSARHAEIQLGARGYFVRDLGSTNGVTCGKVAIDRAPLSDGLKIGLGESVIVVRALGTQTTIPLARPGHLGGLVALSVKMRAFAAALEQAAQADATVLIEGETGTGKELAAQTLHALSLRRSGPLVTCDCAVLAPERAAADLFGHEKGAFTGASQARPGLLEDAEGGTLFLDEIAELPLGLQPLLLGAIERRRSRRIGGRAELSHDVRIVATTSRNLSEEARAGRFRQDLYYRLGVVRLRVPPLRERPDDIPVLAELFAGEVQASLAPEALAPLLAYGWPGNVRELKNTVLRLLVQPGAGVAASLGEARPSGPHAPVILDAAGRIRPWLEVRRLDAGALEREYFQLLLELTEGHQARAAELAQITPQSLSSIVRKHDLGRRG